MGDLVKGQQAHCLITDCLEDEKHLMAFFFFFLVSLFSDSLGPHDWCIFAAEVYAC